jgi:hypothetical protein
VRSCGLPSPYSSPLEYLLCPRSSYTNISRMTFPEIIVSCRFQESSAPPLPWCSAALLLCCSAALLLCCIDGHTRVYANVCGSTMDARALHKGCTQQCACRRFTRTHALTDARACQIERVPIQSWMHAHCTKDARNSARTPTLIGRNASKLHRCCVSILLAHTGKRKS